LADGARLPCKDGAFDLALALTAFSSMPGATMRRAAATELLRVVRRDGAVICYEFARKNPVNRRTVALDERALQELFPGAIVRCRRVTLHPAVRRLLAPFGDGVLGALGRVGALRSHVLAVISRR
jgi:ubiquinone/menaquinone biosynthesis C-methylase UbiE